MTHLFDSFRGWRVVGRSRGRQLMEGLYGVLVIWLFWGVASLLLYAVRQIEAFCRRETVAALIISVLLVLVCGGWMLTFVRERTAAVNAQHRADSLAYQLSMFTQMYDDTDTLDIHN